MTYIQLINKVLLKLRENSQTTLTGNYTQLVGDLVNEAKQFVEAAWPWEALVNSVTFNTVAGQESYNLAALVAGGGAVTSSLATNERSYLKNDTSDKDQLVFDTTSGVRLKQWSWDAVKTYRATRLTATRQAPFAYATRKTAAGMFLELAEPTDKVYTMQAEIVIPQADLSATTDVLNCPSRPVILLAAAMATGERGSGKGARAEDLYKQSDVALQQAMDHDMEGDEFDLVIG